MCQNTIQWKHNGNDITTNTRYIINATSGTLTIPVVKTSDEGNYTCNCSSVSLTVTSKLLLYLCGECDSCEINNNCVYTHYTYFFMNIIVPNIIITGHYTELTIGSSVSINCTTVPPIHNSDIKWHSSSLNTDSNELIINPVMLSHNNKTFTCVVSSDSLDRNLTKDITITVSG